MPPPYRPYPRRPGRELFARRRAGVPARWQGKLCEALEFYEKARASTAAHRPSPEHGAFASLYDNIGVVYASQRRLGEALEMHERALAIKVRRLSADHVEVANM